MTTFDEVHALTHAGSLLSRHGEIVASYDLEATGSDASGFKSLHDARRDILCAVSTPFTANYAAARRVHLINAFGVTLGDSIIGLSALFAIKRRWPHLTFTTYRPAHAPGYVKRLYELAAPLVGGDVIDLPVPLASLPADEPKIDLGNHLFWPSFASMPMIDFFIRALGVDPLSVAPEDKRNRWLRDLALPLPARHADDAAYVLFCPNASTPVRSVPQAARGRIVARLWDEFGLPVYGFGAIDHPHYRDIAARSRDTAEFIAWIGHACYLATPDTAALHIAAGFDVPTTAFFTTIGAALRSRDYANCHAVEFELSELQGIHASARAQDLRALERVYGAYDWRTMPIVTTARPFCRSPETRASVHRAPPPSR
ncbi:MULTISPECIES: ADP-heptose--LPS heptosyltransferase [unclassified Caballeronia]|uniref:glycosyltransferase family 9 protein n=1 Tax=unclassified Caballeronia TaxID=2646786 RepID=UPI002864B889|nr:MULTISPECIES: ADP-heptose--LPS heptosyltransferase [unclassified Caballeronia]MDR5772357.1 ADP-heptose--LPS heptosyltransferase [Caballeronia sp. LZ002]MDR5847791.1 ADP-heptose--LPS heptosyltransferase [Caballeronia sp. LZ003]